MRSNPSTPDSAVPRVRCLSAVFAFVIFFLFFQAEPCRSEIRPVAVLPDSHEIKLGPSIQVLKETSGALEIEDVSSGIWSEKFTDNNAVSINKGMTRDVYWFRFALLPGSRTEHVDYLEGEDRARREWVLHLGRHLDFYDQIDVFWKMENSNNWHSKKFGMYPAVENNSRDPLALRVTLPSDPSVPLVIYIRIEMVAGFFLEPILYSPEAYNLFSRKLAVFYGGYYGLVISMVLYNLFHFFFLRDRVRLIFILYASTLCVYFFVANELSMAIIPVKYLVATRKAAQFLALATMMQMVGFTIAFLDARHSLPVMYRLLQAAALALGVLVLALPFFSYFDISKFIPKVGAVTALVIMWAGTVSWIRGYRPARFFVPAWSFFWVAGLIYALNFEGFFPYAFIGNNLVQVGSGIEMVLLSLAIADRIKYLFEQMGKAQAKRKEQLGRLSRQLTEAEERERWRIAGVLHDSVGQILAATKWEVESLLETCQKENDSVLSNLDTCIREIRTLTSHLYPRVLYERGLKMALQALADDYSKRYGLAVMFRTEDAPEDVSREVRLILYRMTSELMNNVVKHAGASRVVVELAESDGRIDVCVQDDGVGFDLMEEPNENASGFGLFSIRERLDNMQGSLAVERPSPGGVRVTVSVPANLI